MIIVGSRLPFESSHIRRYGFEAMQPTLIGRSLRRAVEDAFHNEFLIVASEVQALRSRKDDPYEVTACLRGSGRCADGDDLGRLTQAGQDLPQGRRRFGIFSNQSPIATHLTLTLSTISNISVICRKFIEVREGSRLDFIAEYDP